MYKIKPGKQAQLDNLNNRLTQIEMVVYTLIHRLTTAAKENNEHGQQEGVGGESERSIGDVEAAPEPCSSAVDALCSESDGARSEEIRTI